MIHHLILLYSERNIDQLLHTVISDNNVILLQVFIPPLIHRRLRVEDRPRTRHCSRGSSTSPPGTATTTTEQPMVTCLCSSATSHHSSHALRRQAMPKPMECALPTLSSNSSLDPVSNNLVMADVTWIIELC